MDCLSYTLLTRSRPLTCLASQQIARAQELAKDPTLALRVSVESGGCHGYQYKMEVTTRREEDD